ncbi:MAG: O-antigen ligase family protein [Acidobacteriota bacterium]|nr:O-antigen ligase family protein [Acidobacteriota bacterium]
MTGVVPKNHDEQNQWGLEMFGLCFYLFVEYTRVAVMYPVLAPLQLGKVSLLMAILGGLMARPRAVAPGNGAMKFFLAFLGVVALLSAVSAHYAVVMSGDLWNMAEQLIVAFLVGRIVTSDWRSKRVTFLLVLLMLKVTQHGLRNYAVNHSRASDEMAFVRFGIIGGGHGFYDNSADLGVAMCVMFGLSVALSMAAMRRKWKLFFLISAGAFAALIIVCGSRGAIVGGAAIVLSLFLHSTRKGWAFIVLALFAAGLVFLMPHASRDRFKSAEDYKNDETANHRVELWKAGLQMWRDYPVLGVGPANFAQVRAANYRINSDHDAQAYVCHSLYIQVVSELGTLGALAALGILFTYFRITMRIRRRLREAKVDRGDWQYCLVSGLRLAMIGYLVSGAFVSVFWYPHIWVLSGLAMGLNAAVEDRLGPERVEKAGVRARAGKMEIAHAHS